MSPGLPPELEAALLVASSVIEVFGVIFIVFAVGHSIFRVVRIEIFHDKRFAEYEHTKRTLIQKIIFALDFFVASDLIVLAVASSITDILNIAIIVGIRTVLSWSLSKEIHLHKE
ncbi:MAG: DUF1622 domain-containing protein [Candidatus Micrarchaeota archaeon]